MKQALQSFFKGWHILDITGFILLALCAVVLPFSWLLSTRVLIVLAFNTLAKLIVFHRVGNPSLERWACWTLWLGVSFYAVYVISLIYTENINDGLSFLLRKAPLLLFPLCALLVDTGHIKSRHRRLLCYFFTASLLVKFLIRVGIKVFVGHSCNFLSSFDPVHHTYMALYLMFALVFLYSEWCTFRRDLPKAVRMMIPVTAALLLCYVVFVMSRTGIAGIVVIGAAVIAHQIFVKKHVRDGLIAMIVIAAVGFSVYHWLPENYRRVSKTLEEVGTGDKSDIRFFIMESAVEVIGDNMPFGLGVGDRDSVMLAYYKTKDVGAAVTSNYNPHNMFLDALLVVGIPGLALMLAILAVPAVMAFRRWDILMLGYLFAVAFSGLFEAILDRQMGIMFTGLFFAVLCATAHKEEGEPAKE
ncbi:MAG: O-antigen ligase family protein [Bacteroidales bacterium]|nr:O-antigen ligase family protein [Bacteroidales bacterium]